MPFEHTSRQNRSVEKHLNCPTKWPGESPQAEDYAEAIEQFFGE
jgi:hypothetical protein